MWANDFRFGSSSSHFSALRPSPIEALSTGRLCHITPSGSGTSPSIFVLNRFTIDAVEAGDLGLGTRVSAGHVSSSCSMSTMKTPATPRV